MKGLQMPLLGLGIGLVAALAVELGYRGWLAAAGRAYTRGAAELELARLVEGIDRDPQAFTAEEEPGPQAAADSMTGAVSHPFWGWSFEAFDRRLFSLAKAFRDDGENTFEIAVLGGSVALGFMRGTARLVELLAADPRFEGRPIRPLTLASGGYKQPQQVNLLTQALNMGWAPEVVINLDGFNELALSAQNGSDSGAHPLHPALFLWGPTTTAGRIDRAQLELLVDMRAAQQRARRIRESGARWHLTASAVLGTRALDQAHAAVADYDRAFGRYAELVAAAAAAGKLVGPPFEPGFEALLALSVQAWYESSLSLHSLCEARGLLYLHALQPTLFDDGSKPLTESELANARAPEAWHRAVREGYPLLRAEGQRLRSRGVHFLDTSDVFREVEDELYFDACHFEGPGNDLLVEAVAAALLEALPQDLSTLAPGD